MKISRKNKVFLIISLSLFVFCMMNSVTFADEPFAPKVNPSKKMANRQMYVNLIKQWKVPSKNTVGLPPYSGAYIVALMESVEMTANDKKFTTLPAMTLATVDEPAKVAAFYKEKLKDWKYKNSFDMFDIFWKGPDDFDNFDITQSSIIPNVVIFESMPSQSDMMPEAKTLITIVYEPVK